MRIFLLVLIGVIGLVIYTALRLIIEDRYDYPDVEDVEERE